MKQEKEKTQKEGQGEEPSKSAKMVWLLLLVVVLAIFGGIVLFTGFLGNQFGKTAENITLSIIAVILAALLYWSKKKE
ncbi:hypothetical protein ACPW7J_07300 [Ihubacter sp. rT4E-8]|uniref:hypothetical protein n=1 Tax=unclassified Ihubacter TaxID=2633299 RepID=UPI001379D2EF